MTIREEQERLNTIIESDLILKEMVQDVLDSKEDVFNRMEYFTRKYQKYSTVFRDVNLSIRYNVDKHKPQVTIYVADKYFKTRIDMYASKDGKEIVEQEINIKTMDLKEKDYVFVDTPIYSEETKHLTNNELYKHIKQTVQDTLDRVVSHIQEEDYPSDNTRKFKVYFNE